ncbi:MAG: DUF5719 family protein, partial [Aquiluna sp.]
MSLVWRGILALLLPGLVVSGFLLLPRAETLAEPASAKEFEVSVDPQQLQIVCPGALVEVGGEDGTQLGLVERVGEASLRVYSQDGITPPPTTRDSVPLEAAGTEQSTELLSAIQSQAISRQRAAGLAATFCEQPTTAGWFISGASGVGNETVLIAANWNEVDTQLIVEVHSPGGVTAERFALAAGQERLISLAPLAALASVYSVKVESTGPAVTLAVQNR